MGYLCNNTRIMGVYERQQREQEIIASAAKIFATKGFGSTKMTDIAKDVNLSVGNLYFYYKNKDELYMAVVLRACEMSIEAIQEGITENEGKNALEKILAISAKYFYLTVNHFQFQDVVSTYISLVVASHRAEQYQGITDRMRKSEYYKVLQQKQWIPAKMFVELIQEGKREGTITCEDSSLLIFTNLWTIAIGFDKLYIPDLNDAHTKELALLDINKWKKSHLTMIRSYLTS